MSTKIIFKILTVAAALALATGNASALTLVEAYEKARLNDPVYRAAFYASESGKENRILGRANMLPVVSGSYSRNKNSADYLQFGRLTHPEYGSHNAVVQLRQPLFNVDAWARYKQGQAQANASAAIFDFESQVLILRVSSAYIEALYSEDQVALVTASRDMYAEQAKTMARMFKAGEGTRTDMLETQAKLDLAEARLLEAKDTQLAARTTLSAVIGDEVKSLDTIGPNFRVRPADRLGFEEWKAQALANNPELRAQMFGLENARAAVLKARAAHMPRLDFVASYTRANSETLNTLGTESTVRSLGIQLNVPIYQGGAINSAARQAVAEESRARAEMDAKTNKILLDLRKDYDAVASSVTRIEALLKAVESAKLLMTATQQSIKGGVRINLDLLNAQEQLYTVQRDLAQARYTYLLGSLRMRAGTGLLTSDDVRETANNFR